MPPLLKQTTNKCLLQIINSLLLIGLLYAAPVWSDNLDQLRASGKIGESANGFAVARDSAVQSEVEAINEKRKAIYAQTQVLAQEYVPFIYLVNPYEMAAVRNHIQNVKFSALGGALWNLYELQLAE